MQPQPLTPTQCYSKKLPLPTSISGISMATQIAEDDSRELVWLWREIQFHLVCTPFPKRSYIKYQNRTVNICRLHIVTEQIFQWHFNLFLAGEASLLPTERISKQLLSKKSDEKEKQKVCVRKQFDWFLIFHGLKLAYRNITGRQRWKLFHSKLENSCENFLIAQDETSLKFSAFN